MQPASCCKLMWYSKPLMLNTSQYTIKTVQLQMELNAPSFTPFWVSRKNDKYTVVVVNTNKQNYFTCYYFMSVVS